MVVADILADIDVVQRNMLLVLRDDGVSQIEPGFHTVVNQVRIVIQQVHQVEWTHQTAQVHVTADQVLADHFAFQLSLPGLGHGVGNPGLALRRLGVQTPFA